MLINSLSAGRRSDLLVVAEKALWVDRQSEHSRMLPRAKRTLDNVDPFTRYTSRSTTAFLECFFFIKTNTPVNFSGYSANWKEKTVTTGPKINRKTAVNRKPKKRLFGFTRRLLPSLVAMGVG